MIYLTIISLILLTIIIVILVILLNIKFKGENELCLNSWHVKLFKFITINDELPSNICSYFWTYVGHLLFVPFNFIFLFLFRKEYKTSTPSIILLSLIQSFLLVVFGIFGTEVLDIQNIFLAILAGALSICAGILSVAIVAYLCYYIIIFIIGIIKRLFKLKDKSKEPKENLLVKRIIDFKNKQCTKIKWI